MHALIDDLWLIFCTFMILFMQAGFLCLESGLVRAKNSINVAVKNLFDIGLGGISFWLLGFGIMFGDFRLLSGLFGQSENTVMFIYQLAFCATAVTLIAGAVSERIRVWPFALIAVFVSCLIYPLFGNWVWHGVVDDAEKMGWLAELGFVDFAGATVVHSIGAWVALAAIVFIGPRQGRFDQESNGKRDIPGHNYPLASLGAVMMYVGWLGFNGGSVGGFNEQVGPVIANTMLSGMAGCMMAGFLMWGLKGYILIKGLISGLLSGLVAITACANVMSELGAIFIGATGSLVSFAGVILLEKLKLDDPIDVIPVHGFAGAWGTIALALVAENDRLGTGLSTFDQLAIQVLGVATAFVWAFAMGYAFIWIVSKFLAIKATPEEEKLGLNMVEHNARTDILDLIIEMEGQRQSGDFSNKLNVEPFTHIGQIAQQYNRVLDKVNEASDEARQKTELSEQALREAEQAKRELGDKVEDLSTFNRFANQRERRMVELKAEINDLCRALGQAPKYDLSDVEGNHDTSSGAP